MNIQETIKSKKFHAYRQAGKIAALIVGVILIALVSFAGGVVVGFTKAKFSYKWGENYERNFTGPHMMGGPRGSLPGFMERGFRNAHGIAGTIISVADNNIAIKDRNGQENSVTVTDKTVIKNRQQDVKIGDLKPDQQIVVMGKPGDNGTINADLIRVFDNSDNFGQ